MADEKYPSLAQVKEKHPEINLNPVTLAQTFFYTCYSMAKVYPLSIQVGYLCGKDYKDFRIINRGEKVSCNLGRHQATTLDVILGKISQVDDSLCCMSILIDRIKGSTMKEDIRGVEYWKDIKALRSGNFNRGSIAISIGEIEDLAMIMWEKLEKIHAEEQTKFHEALYMQL